MREARVQAQAKINTQLQVMPRDDATGYHDIATIFQRIDLADEIVIRTGVVGRSLDVSGPRVPEGGLGPIEKNLAYRAAVEFANRTGWPDGFAIELTKNIPVGGGLGGGSADAGGVLRALNALAPTPLSEQDLWSVACALGSDVPFLAKEWIKAFGTGRGTQLQNMDRGRGVQHHHVLIAVPGFSISTADAYRWLDEDRARAGYKFQPRPLAEIPFVRIDTRPDASPGVPRVPPAGYTLAPGARAILNDFEPVIEARFREIARIRERIASSGAFWALLAGSGSCVLGLFGDTPLPDSDLGIEAELIRTRTSSRVVQVEVLK